MTLVQRGKKWILYGDNGKIIIISTDRRICEKLMQKRS